MPKCLIPLIIALILVLWVAWELVDMTPISAYKSTVEEHDNQEASQ